MCRECLSLGVSGYCEGIGARGPTIDAEPLPWVQGPTVRWFAREVRRAAGAHYWALRHLGPVRMGRRVTVSWLCEGRVLEVTLSLVPGMREVRIDRIGPAIGIVSRRIEPADLARELGRGFDWLGGAKGGGA
jgi:hypothetical protein